MASKNNDKGYQPKAIKKMIKEDEKKAKTDGKKSGKNTGKNRKGKKKEVSRAKKFWKFMLKLFVFLMIAGAITGGAILAGIYYGWFGENYQITMAELAIGENNSVIVDVDGNVIADLTGVEQRKIIALDEMNPYLPQAYIAIEDQRYYEHEGVDIKRTAAAVLNVLQGDMSFGGSTITQQLIKNLTDEDARTGVDGVVRKVREWSKAFQVERLISKTQVLELYLNVLFVGGPNVHGVELGSNYYFNKSASEIDLAECAFLAGINHSPNAYNPYDSSSDQEKVAENIKNRTLTVLTAMKEQGMITDEDEYAEAVEKVKEGLEFEDGIKSIVSSFSSHTEAVINQVVEQVMVEKEMSRTAAENYVYSSGLTIYSTVDMEIQERLEEEYLKDKYIIAGRSKDGDGELKNETSQSAMTIIDHSTGNVIGIVGGLGEQEAFGLNRATKSVRQTGSSIKPIAVIAPALEEGVITAGTMYYDISTDFGGNYTPKNQSYFKGAISIRDFIASSQNIPAVKIIRELTAVTSVEYLNKMGISSLNVEDDAHLSLALGGTTNGATTLEMAAAYAMIANGGVYITPTFYSKVEDSSGNVIMLPNQEQTRVISSQNAYITQSILKEPVTNSTGTASYCAISGIDVGAKTGTTDDDFDRWLVGITPYYAAACWYGYDINETVYFTGTNPAGQIWSSVMKDIHSGLDKATFEEPSGIVKKSTCRITGCLAITGCTDTYYEIYTENNLPDKCTGHGTQIVCLDSGKLASEYCTNVEEQVYGLTLPKESKNLWTSLTKIETYLQIIDICTEHEKEEEVEEVEDEEVAPQVEETPEENLEENLDTEENVEDDYSEDTENGEETHQEETR